MLRCGSVAIAAALLAFALVAPSAASGRALSPALRADVDQLAAAQMRLGDFPGLVVAIDAPGRGTYLRAYGRASLATGRRMSTADHFRIGSLTKTFTATVILRLVEEGRLRLGDTINRWYPRVPNSSRITVRMLLNHTSGLPNLSPGLYLSWLNSRGARAFTPDQLIAAAVRQPPVFPPGRGYNYTNTEYLLLGQIAQRVSGATLDALYARYVIGPLALRRTAFHPSRTLPDPDARGYWFDGRRRVDVSNWNFSWTGAAGGMTSTAADLLRYAAPLATGRGLLSAPMQRQRLQTVATGLAGMRYGLGIFTLPIEVAPNRFETLVGHDGEIQGYNAVAFYSPAHRASFVVLGNTAPALNPLTADAAGADVVQLAAEIFATLY